MLRQKWFAKCKFTVKHYLLYFSVARLLLENSGIKQSTFFASQRCFTPYTYSLQIIYDICKSTFNKYTIFVLHFYLFYKNQDCYGLWTNETRSSYCAMRLMFLDLVFKKNCSDELVLIKWFILAHPVQLVMKEYPIKIWCRRANRL